MLEAIEASAARWRTGQRNSWMVGLADHDDKRKSCATSRAPPLPHRRATISFLISAMALAGFRLFGQVRVQFMMVWQR